ncbi:ATP-binding protein [Rhodococcus sp. SJ-2]
MSRRTILLLSGLVIALVAMVVASVDWSDIARRDPARSLLLGPRESFAAAQGPYLPVFSPTEMALFVCAGVAFLVAGAVAWTYRPHDLTGLLLVVAGALWLLGGLRRSSNPVAFTVGIVATNLYLPLLLQAVIGFPTGRLQQRWERWFVGAAWALAVVGVAAEWMFFDPRAAESIQSSTSTNLLLIRHGPEISDAIQLGVGTGAVVLTAILVGVVVARLKRGSPAYRAGFAPLGIACAAAGLLTIATLAIAVPGSPHTWILNLRYPGAALFPLAVAIGLVRYRLTRAAVTDAMVEIGDIPIDVGFVDALRRAVHDPSLALWTYSDGTYLDSDGEPQTLPRRSRTRGFTLLEHEGTPAGVLVYDATLEAQPELLAAVRGATSLALDHDRLQRALEEQLAEVRRSRERIVTAGDVQRRRLERNLHDGAQQRLVAASLLLRRAQRTDDGMQMRSFLTDGAAELNAALTELRDLARGVYPPVLAERGLAVALNSMAERAPIPVCIDEDLESRLPSHVELAAYLIASEAVTNAAKHSSATLVRIMVYREGDTLRLTVTDNGSGGARRVPGGGLDGLSDRAEALGGSFTLDSPTGCGTTLTVTLQLRADADS